MASWGARRDIFEAEQRNIARQEEERLRQEQQRNALAEILRGAYEPAQAAQPAIYGPVREEYLGGVEPSGVGREAMPERAGGFNMQNAIAAMAQSRFAPEAMKLEQDLYSKDSDIRKVMLEHKLKQDAQNAMFDRMRGFSGGSSLQPGYTMEVGPQGPKMGFDPAKAASLALDQERAFYETGRRPEGAGTGVSGGVRPPSLTPKGEAEASAKRLKDLEESATSRQGALERAKKFSELIQSGKMKTGAGRLAAGYVPGVYTEQGQLDEEFNAFAETAARQALKAAGEQRPTDADVKGMKEAMFGIGRDETTNINLLHSYITQQTQDENAYRSLKGLPQLPLPEPPAKQYKLGDFIDKGGKRYVIKRLDPNGDHEIMLVK